MIVTVTTDAAFHTKHKVGAYAFWITSDLGRLKAHGVLKKTKSSCDSEIQCILNALHYMGKAVVDRNISRIIINTDSMNAIHVFEGNKDAIKRYRLKWAEHYKHIFQKLVSVPVELRHVKAHKSTSDARSYVNDWCDKKAKESLWKKINGNSTLKP